MAMVGIADGRVWAPMERATTILSGEDNYRWYWICVESTCERFGARFEVTKVLLRCTYLTTHRQTIGLSASADLSRCICCMHPASIHPFLRPAFCLYSPSMTTMNSSSRKMIAMPNKNDDRKWEK
jgi:hypothetical protein